ncbi:uncharacterized protein BDZ99DRAFT_568882 [Mytilinidion resinicola]|uniref:Uncharacterized protein n=1 Tax=Mytilinidion resinicola TaxID=574789 RepID=A0A6A6YTP4_9PEZI|nr:uncharacterized protein BDZ99DRAFT_568882 [Mytilinidion resinicola]KAF2812141.1 hypothetical protein BDZ99DRAFT_568882 [Mytilinidion resinicola]
MPLNPSNPTITRPPPNAVVYDLSSPTQTTITLPPNSTWTSGLHYHTTHTEYLRLLHGSISLRLGTATTILTAPPDGTGIEVTVPRGVRHEWRRADSPAVKQVDGDGDVVVVERTDPADGAKSVFFWNLNGAILDGGRGRGWWGAAWLTMELLIVFRALDNWPVFVDLGAFGGVGRALEACVAHGVLGAAGAAGWLAGIQAVRRERMPGALWEGWVGGWVGRESEPEPEPEPESSGGGGEENPLDRKIGTVRCITSAV